MASTDYVFLTHWRVPGTREELYDLLKEARDLPRWWPSVYLQVTTVVPGRVHGLGGVAELHTKGWLPYTLRWRSTMTETQYPAGFCLAASGDFVGTGEWRFRQEGAEVEIEFEWRIRADKPLLRRWSWLLRPIFAANHRWAMRQGEASLRLELRRRRAADAAARALVPPPPGPSFVRRREEAWTPP